MRLTSSLEISIYYKRRVPGMGINIEVLVQME